MAYISVNNNESIESALRRFKRKVISEEIIKDLKKHAHFIPPGQKAKLKSVNAPSETEGVFASSGLWAAVQEPALRVRRWDRIDSELVRTGSGSDRVPRI
jgi:small subunit ribosomal protein S21